MQTTTLTSKGQITIPSAILKKIKLQKGDKLIVEEKNGKLILEPAQNLINTLYGSVKIPKAYQGLTPDQMIAKAKSKYFKSNKS